MQTGKNIHSHNVRSPLSQRNEVSGFGDDGEGDDGDNWIIECLNENGKILNDVSIQTENGMKFAKKIVKGDTILQIKH